MLQVERMSKDKMSKSMEDTMELTRNGELSMSIQAAIKKRDLTSTSDSTSTSHSTSNQECQCRELFTTQEDHQSNSSRESISLRRDNNSSSMERQRLSEVCNQETLPLLSKAVEMETEWLWKMSVLDGGNSGETKVTNLSTRKERSSTSTMEMTERTTG